jgi:hypothetical protein
MKTQPADFLRTIHNRIAEAAVGPSALRNQGASGVVRTAREYFKRLNLKTFAVSKERDFLRKLDAATDDLRNKFPKGAKHWGAARKALNLFLRDALYSTFLSKQYHLEKIEPWLEIPLDQYVAAGLHRDYLGEDLPKWDGIKRLTPENSMAFQSAARLLAQEKGIARIHLDLYYWRAKADT